MSRTSLARSRAAMSPHFHLHHSVIISIVGWMMGKTGIHQSSSLNVLANWLLGPLSRISDSWGLFGVDHTRDTCWETRWLMNDSWMIWYDNHETCMLQSNASKCNYLTSPPLTPQHHRCSYRHSYQTEDQNKNLSLLLRISQVLFPSHFSWLCLSLLDNALVSDEVSSWLPHHFSPTCTTPQLPIVLEQIQQPLVHCISY